jgi:hypothetical protein
MINNSIKIAQYKLNQHRLQGEKSKLNIFEVAQLMDSIKTSQQIKNSATSSVFYSVYNN